MKLQECQRALAGPALGNAHPHALVPLASEDWLLVMGASDTRTKQPPLALGAS